ncbi:lanosterol 14-alpha-demethylase [Dothidotthia symphoricarpi CBS 119687]|uniref:Lanosterol 14-alpha-demethylase n=1 Tax=Dothidotthia symphoricarpi CBS 119687 TaxID=1392245 RepID=A0A6A6ASH3_9PLEO|nr:lanosterol 14-alpha-demethylase [Dothidotthia symphoricarpi CBS 119687]KAF2134163.1 lanosterol 14-alpha-demethylase [Dothidotthia symphoricarpi CBS 119687]
MPAQTEKSQLKRSRQSQGEVVEPKKARRSQRQPSPTPHKSHLKQGQLPSPITHKESTASEDFKEGTVTPPNGKQTHSQPRGPGGLSSPPSDTQPFSQCVYPPDPRTYAVDDEEGEQVWGYLVPLDDKSGDTLVLRRREGCPVPQSMVGQTTGKDKVSTEEYKRQEEIYEKEKKEKGVNASGYLIGRHRECDRILESPTVSNRHCLLFTENKGGDAVAVLEDLSGNGTFVNEAIVGRNKRRVLKEGDEIAILDEARYVFRYPRQRNTHGFRQQYTIQEQLGKGHFASVYLCIEKSSGIRYAVKKFEKRSGPGERSKVEGLQQEIAVLMGISHPTLLCLKDTYDEDDGVYLVLELATEGELFNWIVMKQKLSESETRKVFVQLFQAVKYLHERNIVHRDIKPENILLTDKELHIKLADFGLAKIIGEESFTTTLCGTPSYVAPEILENSNHRRYTRAVDVWSLGVVLYICLCGFPPFSDELYSPDNPYTLSQQIREARFDYPSPYWDSVGDPALDLIDRMLTRDVDQRITIDECLQHPWVTLNNKINPNDSTDGLTGAIAGLDFSKRKVQRERTMLSSVNDIKVTRVIKGAEGQDAVKVYEKNITHGAKKVAEAGFKEVHPANERHPKEFIEMGGKGDEVLYAESHDGSHYPTNPDAASASNTCTRRMTGQSLRMGVVADIAGPLGNFTSNSSFPVVAATGFASFILVAIVLNILKQLLLKNPNEPPLVFHWLPVIGNTITYGMDPYGFFFANHKKYGNVFTFILLGRKMTVCLDTVGNNFILNGKSKDVNAEEIYSPLTTPVFGKDVVYDCPNSKLMEQKKFVKFGLTTDALRSYVVLITQEVDDFFKRHKDFKGQQGSFNVPKVMAELTIYTASRSLQGQEIRNAFDSKFAELYHDLDMGFSPVNFMLSWAPLPHNRARDNAHETMIKLYSDIVRKRRAGEERKEHDMIWHLMDCKYKDGTQVPEHEIAGIMIALLMAGQHSSSSTIAWILLRLAQNSHLIEELLAEQKSVLGDDLPALTYEDLQRLPLHAQIVKETLRIHAPIHSIMRKVKQPLVVDGTNYTVPTSHTLMSSPGFSAQLDTHFVNPAVWDPHRWDADASFEEVVNKDEENIDYGWGVVSKGTNSPYLPFGAGRHRCIGEQFAYLQLQTILVAFVREFKMRNPGGSKDIVGTDYSSLFSRPLSPAVVEWERRSKGL